MIYCPREAIRPFLGHLPDLLVPPEAVAKIEALVATLPDGMSHFGVECRLAGGRAQVDFSVGIQWLDGGRDAFAATASEASRDDAGWSAIRGLTDMWCDPDSSLYVRMSGLWLEFDLDLDGAASEQQPPSVFVLFRRPPPADDHRDLFAAVLASVLEELVGQRRASVLQPRILSFADALPPRAWLSYVAVMLPRPDRPVRVIAAGLPAELVPAFLDRVGWQTPKAKLETLREVAPFLSSLSLEVSETTGSRIDLELRVEPSRRAEQWASVFETLQKLGLATREKCEALRPWWGWQTLPLPGTEPYLVWTSINHVKITCAEELPLAAKAYVSARLGIFPPDAKAILL